MHPESHPGIVPYPSCKCAPAEVHGATPQNNTMKRPSRVMEQRGFVVRFFMLN